ncbi:MAG: hypothetical protein SCM96_07725 [Acidobacteriota bacterium]|nr:hypothetical protein [Acidobacteriota bacterium]
MDDFSIDYDNLDISTLMAAVKERAARRAGDEGSPEETFPVPEPDRPQDTGFPADDEPFLAPYPDFPDDEPGGKSRIKRILLKLMRPFAPLMKLVILPINEDIVRAVRHLDYVNRRVDYYAAKSEHELRRADRRFAALQEVLGREREALARELQRVEQETADALGGIRSCLTPAVDNVKLLHTLAHNTVVELTKLKIEHETLKNKIRVMEKDFETLSRRERALEKKVFE